MPHSVNRRVFPVAALQQDSNERPRMVVTLGVFSRSDEIMDIDPEPRCLQDCKPDERLVNLLPPDVLVWEKVKYSPHSRRRRRTSRVARV